MPRQAVLDSLPLRTARERGARVGHEAMISLAFSSLSPS